MRTFRKGSGISSKRKPAAGLKTTCRNPPGSPASGRATCRAARVAQALLGSLTDAYQFHPAGIPGHPGPCRPLSSPTTSAGPSGRSRTFSSTAPRGSRWRARRRSSPMLPTTGILASSPCGRSSAAGRMRSAARISSLLIEKIDEEVVRQHNARELATLARPLFHVLSDPRAHSPTAQFPSKRLLVFLRRQEAPDPERVRPGNLPSQEPDASDHGRACAADRGPLRRETSPQRRNQSLRPPRNLLAPIPDPAARCQPRRPEAPPLPPPGRSGTSRENSQK